MSLLAPGRNIVLVGMMGAGKSTVGRLLAERLERPFADTDAVVAGEANCTIAEIFGAGGEREFRRLEGEAVRSVAALRGQVIAAGGGMVLDPSNVTHLRATGDIVFLDAAPEVLARRVGDVASRPLLAAADAVVERLGELRAERLALYTRAAAHTIDTTGQTPEETAAAVVRWAQTQPGLLSRDEQP